MMMIHFLQYKYIIFFQHLFLPIFCQIHTHTTHTHTHTHIYIYGMYHKHEIAIKRRKSFMSMVLML